MPFSIFCLHFLDVQFAVQRMRMWTWFWKQNCDLWTATKPVGQSSAWILDQSKKFPVNYPFCVNTHTHTHTHTHTDIYVCWNDTKTLWIAVIYYGCLLLWTLRFQLDVLISRFLPVFFLVGYFPDFFLCNCSRLMSSGVGMVRRFGTLQCSKHFGINESVLDKSLLQCPAAVSFRPCENCSHLWCGFWLFLFGRGLPLQGATHHVTLQYATGPICPVVCRWMTSPLRSLELKKLMKGNIFGNRTYAILTKMAAKGPKGSI